jgi:zinc/manganese transport system ATP-binding protein
VLSALYGHHVDVLQVHGRVLVVAGEAGELADSGDHSHTQTQVEIIS